MLNKKNFSSWLSSKGVEFIVSEQAPQPPVDVGQQAIDNARKQQGVNNANAQKMTLEQRMKADYGHEFLINRKERTHKALGHYFIGEGYIVMFNEEEKRMTALNNDYTPTKKVVKLENKSYSGFIKAIMKLHELLNNDQPLIFSKVRGYQLQPFEGWYDKEKQAGGIKSYQVFISKVALCRAEVLSMYMDNPDIKFIVTDLIPENECFRNPVDK
jgi:hypothetical protein